MGRRLRWGVLGAANIALVKVIPGIQGSSNGVVVALASRNEERGRAAAARLGIDRIHGSYEALLHDPEVDAIYNPLPNSLHAEWTIRAAEAGKAILCEKPLALDAAEAQRVVDACTQHGVPLMEAFMYRHHPQNVRVRELVAQGAIGRVNEVRANLCFDMLNPPDPTNVRLRPDLGGGARLDMGCYSVNATRMAFGEEPLRALAWHDVDERFGVDVAMTGVLEYPDRRVATVSCSFKAGYQGWYTILGSEGFIEVPRAIIPGWDQLAADTIVAIYDRNTHRREERFAPVDHYQLMAEAFSASVLAGEPVPYPPDDAIRNMRVLDALGRSAAQDTAVAVK
ncbi:MAG: Gfo/Idh/MocA family protein [Chloroflexota bacterium]